MWDPETSLTKRIVGNRWWDKGRCRQLLVAASVVAGRVGQARRGWRWVASRCVWFDKNGDGSVWPASMAWQWALAWGLVVVVVVVGRAERSWRGGFYFFQCVIIIIFNGVMADMGCTRHVSIEGWVGDGFGWRRLIGTIVVSWGGDGMWFEALKGFLDCVEAKYGRQDIKGENNWRFSATMLHSFGVSVSESRSLFSIRKCI